MSDVPLVTRLAFQELSDLVRARGGAEVAVPAEEEIAEQAFVAELAKLDEETIRALGEARADTSLKAEPFEGDPLRMLKTGPACFYEGRSNYGAASLELTPKKAIVRFVISEPFAKSTAAPILLRAFLERSVEMVAGERMIARFAGNTPRVGGRFDTPMYNSVFEFELD